MTNAALFHKYVKGKNIMTPYVVEYITIPNGVVELSKGKGIFSGTLYGVTVVKDERKADELCDCFYDYKDAMAYIETLKKG